MVLWSNKNMPTQSNFNRKDVFFKPLDKREDKVYIERDEVLPTTAHNLSDDKIEKVKVIAKEIKAAKERGSSIMLAFGAHTIKNCLSPVMIALMEEGYLTHLATNGAGIIHDWEFAFQGHSSEDVRENVSVGEFGIWQETGFFINLALVIGAYEGKGYGASVGSFILSDGANIPSEKELLNIVGSFIKNSDYDKTSSAVDLLQKVREFNLVSGKNETLHPFKKYSVQAQAYKLGIPLTGHPMFGHDIIYTHPMNTGSAIGHAAERDFLTYADGVSKLDGGVYLSIGSAVMSPMIFEKSLSMSRNVAIQKNEKIEDFSIHVVDLAKSTWDWSNGEPPETDSAYYLRYMKTFNRMGGRISYTEADNRDFLLALYQELHK